MTTVKLRYIDRFKDRHGHTRYYFRRPGGKRTALPGAPGSEEFRLAYEAAERGEKPEKVVKRPRGAPGTFDALLELYLKLGIMDSKPITQRQTRSTLERLVQEEGWGPRKVADLRREHVLMMLSKRQDRPGAATTALAKLRAMFRFAMEQQPPWITSDPCLKVKSPKLGKHHTWTEPEIAQYEARWPTGVRERVALDLLLYTGQRVGDVAKMTRHDVEGDGIWVVQQKTGTKLLVPIHSRLAASLAAWNSGHILLLPSERGKAFTGKTLSKFMSKAIGAAALPDRCVAHGVRKGAARRLAEAGCSAKMIMAVLGWKSLAEAERYTAAADQVRLARAAMQTIR